MPLVVVTLEDRVKALEERVAALEQALKDREASANG